MSKLTVGITKPKAGQVYIKLKHQLKPALTGIEGQVKETYSKERKLPALSHPQFYMAR